MAASGEHRALLAACCASGGWGAEPSPLLWSPLIWHACPWILKEKDCLLTGWGGCELGKAWATLSKGAGPALLGARQENSPRLIPPRVLTFQAVVEPAIRHVRKEEEAGAWGARARACTHVCLKNISSLSLKPSISGLAACVCPITSFVTCYCNFHYSKFLF